MCCNNHERKWLVFVLSCFFLGIIRLQKVDLGHKLCWICRDPVWQLSFRNVFYLLHATCHLLLFVLASTDTKYYRGSVSKCFYSVSRKQLFEGGERKPLLCFSRMSTCSGLSYTRQPMGESCPVRLAVIRRWTALRWQRGAQLNCGLVCSSKLLWQEARKWLSGIGRTWVHCIFMAGEEGRRCEVSSVSAYSCWLVEMEPKSFCFACLSGTVST